jgi:Ca-activated chloride channel family protein
LLVRGLDAWRRRRLAAVVALPRQAMLCSEAAPTQRRLRVVLGFVMLLCLGGAAMQPLYGEQMRRIEQRGVDILICLDVSRSMLARDIAPSRLLRARREIKALAEQVGADRLGLVAFAGEARLLIPLTQDKDTFAALVDHADPFSVRRGGTDLGQALTAAMAALDGASGDHEVVLLLTDGEDLEGRGLAAATAAAALHISVHCVGFGSTMGSKIALEDRNTGSEEFLRGPRGEEVVSTMDAESLRKIAEAAGGEFVRADSMPLPLVELYNKRIQPKAKKAFEAEERREKVNRFQWPLLAAVVLWFLEACLTGRRRTR